MATGGIAPLVVIVGPTASGKTNLAIELAEQFCGEIICADSRTVYKGMDIGTAKPTTAEQARVPHWGLDLVTPGQSYNAADFKAYTNEKITEIRKRDKVPFIVGGTGLYIDAVLFDYQFGPPMDPSLRHMLDVMTIEQLHEYCDKNNVVLPENRQNKRYVIRAIEQKNISTTRQTKPIKNCIIVGIATNKSELRTRIVQRTEHLFQNSVVDEATLLGKKYGWDNEAMTGNIYPLCHAYLAGDITLDEAKEKFTTLDWRLAKRQMTWFQRNPFIEWLSLTEANDYITTRLVSE